MTKKIIVVMTLTILLIMGGVLYYSYEQVDDIDINTPVEPVVDGVGEEYDLGEELSDEDVWEQVKSDSLTIINFGKLEDLKFNYIERIDGEDNYGVVNKITVNEGSNILYINDTDRIELYTNGDGYVTKVVLEQQNGDDIENESRELIRYHVVYGLLGDTSTSVKTHIGKLINKHNFYEHGLTDVKNLPPYRITQESTPEITTAIIEYVGD